jgi:hypothetical protein
LASTHSPPRPAAAIECEVIARAALDASPEQIAALRKSPGRLGDSAIAPGLLRHADEQTVAGLAAVLRAVADGGLDPSGFGDWAVLAAPRYLGRGAFLGAFPQYAAEGAWGVSPHLIPAHSLHSPSGTISQALKAHGMNLGIGGTPGGAGEALSLAAMLLESGLAPGVWVVLTGRSPGLDLPEDQAGPLGTEALALALAAPAEGRRGIRLRVGPDSVALIEGPGDSGGSVAAWIAPVILRAESGSGPAVPRPHFLPRPSRAGTLDPSRGPS